MRYGTIEHVVWRGISSIAAADITHLVRTALGSAPFSVSELYLVFRVETRVPYDASPDANGKFSPKGKLSRVVDDSERVGRTWICAILPVVTRRYDVESVLL